MPVADYKTYCRMIDHALEKKFARGSWFGGTGEAGGSRPERCRNHPFWKRSLNSNGVNSENLCLTVRIQKSGARIQKSRGTITNGGIRTGWLIFSDIWSPRRLKNL